MIPSRIVIVGSSSVYGRGDPERGGFVGRLRSWHEPRASKNLVYNLGVGGDTTQGMLKRFDSEVSFCHPDLIIVYPGLNDCRREGSETSPNATSSEQFKQNIKSLLLKSKSLAPTIFISSFPIDQSRTKPFGPTNFFYLTEDATEFTKLAREVCDELKVKYLEIFEKWNTENVREFSVDGLHGTPEAHEKLFTELRKFLCDMFE